MHAHFLAAWNRLRSIRPKWWPAAVIVLLTAVNIRGLREGVWVQNVFTVLKVAALAALIIAGLSHGIGSPHFIPPAETAGQGDWSWGRVCWRVWPWPCRRPCSPTTPGIPSPSWPRRFTTRGARLPYSLLLGTAVVTVVYVLANLAYLAVLPVDRIAGVEDDRVAVAVGDALFGDVGAKLVIAAVLVSTFGCLNGLILGGARLCFAMARDGLFLRSCAKLHPRSGTPATALVYQGIVSIVLTFTGSYSGLLTYTMFASVLFTGLMVAAVYRLRFKQPDLPPALSLLGLSGHAGVVPGDVPGVPGLRDQGQPARVRDRRAVDRVRRSVLCDLAAEGRGDHRPIASIARRTSGACLAADKLLGALGACTSDSQSLLQSKILCHPIADPLQRDRPVYPQRRCKH